MITLTLPERLENIRGGQFANLSVGDGSMLLRRPLGICKVEGSDVSLCYQIKGKGTAALKKVKQGDKLNVLLPLGNGFDLSGFKRVAVVGGGVGVFPLIASIRENKNIEFYTYIGFRNRAVVCLTEELEKSKKLTIVTDDGSLGAKDNAVGAFMKDIDAVKADAIISCGPPVMLKALKQQILKLGIKIPCFVSLEERMGCGVGACLVCVCKKLDGGNARVCKDGPVFNINEVEL